MNIYIISFWNDIFVEDMVKTKKTMNLMSIFQAHVSVTFLPDFYLA